MINKLSKEIYKRNVDKGFYEIEKSIGETIALIHSEVSEALECDREDKYCRLTSNVLLELSNEKNNGKLKAIFELMIKDTFEDELADIMIRVMDLAGYLKIDLEGHIKAKMQYNLLRPYKHGKKY